MNSSIKKYSTLFILIQILFSALLFDVPVELNQPNGSTLNCYVSGDEYYNYFHDIDGYTIVQSEEDGYYYYAHKQNHKIVPSIYRADQTHDLVTLGFSKKTIISKSAYLEKRDRKWSNIDQTRDAPTIGTLNNLNVFIRFADEDEFQSPRSYYDSYFNGDAGPSMKHYFQEVSYDTLTVNTIHYPESDMTSNISYQDEYPRCYYQPYNAVTNPCGYPESEVTFREHTLLANAIAYIEDQVPDDLIIDADNDGRVDNVTFLVSGSPGGWAELLWPHRWALYSQGVYIEQNGEQKRVWDYNFNLAVGPYFSVGTLCHEFAHSLGAPDLYHYWDDVAPVAVGGWDVMDASTDIPQYPSSYIKYRYFDWITLEDASIGGTFILNPVTSRYNSAYRLNSINPNEYFILEYRTQNGIYDVNAPGNDTGLLIYRVNNLYNGQGNANGPPDELYLYRVGGTLNSSGSFGAAPFSFDLGKTEFNDSTNPSSFLSDNSPGGINIVNIGSAGETIEFTVMNLVLLGQYDGFHSDSDNDGIINPGEDVLLEFSMSNMSTDVAAYNVMGYFSTSSNVINFPSEGIEFGDLNPNQSATSEFIQISIPDDIELGILTIDLMIEAFYEQEDTDNMLIYTGTSSFNIDISINQQGFPHETDFAISSSPILLDIDNDDNKELIFGDYDGFIRAFKSNGVEVINGIYPYETGDQIWGSPASADLDLDGIIDFIIGSKDKKLYLFDQNGFKTYTDLGSFLMATPAIGNIDDDDELEIIIGGYSGGSGRKIYALNHDLSMVDGFPVLINERVQKGVSLADFNGNGKQDIVFGTDSDNIYLMLDDGSIASGFPFQADGSIKSSPTILEINNQLIIFASTMNGSLYSISEDGSERFKFIATDDIKTSPALLNHLDQSYVFFGDSNGYLYALDTNGNLLSNFPINFSSPIAGSVVFTDLNSDSISDVIFGTEDGNMHAMDIYGNYHSYMPIEYPFAYRSAPIVEDIDNDGDLEIIAGTSLSINALDLKGSGSSDGYWSMYKGNFRRDGFHQFIITCIPGDLNYDSLIDILDVVIIVQYIIGAVDELECGDINGDAITDILDIISLLNSILDN